MREGIQHTELTGLLEANGRAHARREAAAADAATSESLQQNEATRLANQQSAAEAEWSAADKASRESEQILRDATADRRTTATRLARVKDERARVERDTSDDSGPIGSPRLAELAHDAAGLAAEQRALEENADRLDAQLADLRAKAATLREAAAAAKSKLDQVVAGRRQAAAAMAASIAGRARDRVDAEREISDLTAQIGRVAADVRPPHASLLSAYQNIDRLTETIGDRSAQLAAIEQARSHYDHRKLLAGLGLVTCMLVVISAALWKFLK
jgi:chromosome segregation ATPase